MHLKEESLYLYRFVYVSVYVYVYLKCMVKSSSVQETLGRYLRSSPSDRMSLRRGHVTFSHSCTVDQRAQVLLSRTGSNTLILDPVHTRIHNVHGTITSD